MHLLRAPLQWKFMSAFRALGHSALHRRWTARTSECPAICYIESEATFRAIHDMPRLRAHFGSLSVYHPLSDILKTFLEMLKQIEGEIIKTINLITIETVKSMIKKHMKFGNVAKN